MSFLRGVQGIGKGIGVGSFRRPANPRILPFVITTACCKGYRLGIGHTRLPMKEHLGRLQVVTVLRGRPGNYGHIKAIVRHYYILPMWGYFFGSTHSGLPSLPTTPPFLLAKRAI